MRYTLLLHFPEMMADGQLSDEAMEEGQAAFNAYAKALNAAGALITAEVLQPTSATTSLSRKTGELLVQDGPFVDTKEALGGTFVIDVADLDAALEWAQQAPSVYWGTVEIRPGATWFDPSADAWQGDPRG